MGTISGGSLTIRGSPLTIVVSLLNARRLSFARVLARFFSISLRRFALALALNSLIRVAASTREYQRSNVFIDASPRIASRYDRVTSRFTARR